MASLPEEDMEELRQAGLGLLRRLENTEHERDYWLRMSERLNRDRIRLGWCSLALFVLCFVCYFCGHVSGYKSGKESNAPTTRDTDAGSRDAGSPADTQADTALP